MDVPAPWLPQNQRPPDFMRGESRGTGEVWHVPGWTRWSDNKRLRHLRGIVNQYGHDPHMRWYTVRVLEAAGAAPRDYRAQAAAILRHVQTIVYYSNEKGEQLQSPWRTIAVRTGDCDDSAVLVATMADSIRLPWRLVLGGNKRRWFGGSYPVRGVENDLPAANYAHIYVDLGWPPFSEGKRLPDGSPATTWMAAEPTVRGAPLGYDVIKHGPPKAGPNGTAILPELAGWGSVQWGGASATRRYAGEEELVPAAPPNPSPVGITTSAPGSTPVSRMLARVRWDLLVLGVVQATISGLLIQALMKRGSGR